MSIAGQVVEVQVTPRGGALVTDVSAGGTSLTVDNATPFETTGRVLVDGTVYDYTTRQLVDAPSDVDGQPQQYAVLGLTSGLVADEIASSPVSLWAGDAATGQVLSDVTLLVDTYTADADPVPIYLTSTLRQDWTAYAGIVDPPIAVTISDDQQRLEDAPGWTPRLDGTLIDPATLPEPAAATAPDVSPAFTVTGNTDGLLVYTDPVAPTTLLDYYVDGVAVLTGQRSTVVLITTNAAGQPMTADAPETTYSITVVAHNERGSAAASGPVSASRNPQVTTTQVIAQLVSGFVMAGSIQVGNITLNPDTGLTIPLANGGLIHFPADGSPAVITAAVVATSATITQLLLQGRTNVLAGLFTMSAGISNPTNPPMAMAGWTDPTQRLQFTQPDETLGGGLADEGDAWLTAGTTQLYRLDKTTGATTKVNAGRRLGTVLGVAYTSDGVRCALVRTDTGVHYLGTNAGGTWNYSTITLPGTSPARPALTSTGTRALVVTWTTNDAGVDNIVTEQYDTATRLRVGSISHSLQGPKQALTGAYFGNADFGAGRLVVTDLNHVRVFSFDANLDGTRVDAEAWAPANGENTAGLAWDGTRFHTLTPGGPLGGRVWHYARLPRAVQRTITYTKYDGNSAGVGTQETAPSPVLTYTQPPRTWLLLNADPVAADTGVDLPDRPRFYVANHRQPEVAAGAVSQMLELPTTDGPAAPTSNGFAASGAATGQVASEAADGSSKPLTWLGGDGAGRIARLIQSGVATVNVTTTNTPTSVNVTFPVPFPTMPRVTVTVNTGSPHQDFASRTNVTTTGFTLFVTRTTATGTRDVDWTATVAA